MPLRRLLTTVAVLVTLGVCGRLGLWQVSRMHEKQQLRAAFDSTLAAEPNALAMPVIAATVAGQKVSAAGTYDFARQILLSARSHAGDTGVGVVTPLLLEDGSAILVDRGWMPAADAMTADPLVFSEPSPQLVTGIARTIPAETGPTRWVLLPTARAMVWSTYSLSRDSLATRFPYAIAPVLIEQLPGSGVPVMPRREAPERPDPSTHFWYAVQWFAVALIVSIGSVWAARHAADGRHAAVLPGA